MRINNIWIGLGVSIAFFIVGLITLPRYGINWDTINHLPRGQAYLHFFLTGKKDYSDLPKFNLYWQKPESLGINTNIPKNQVLARSYYQSDAADFKGFIESDGGGHPPLSDILSSVFNRVLFGKLRVINDIDSYRVYSIFLASSLVGLIFYWVGSNFGLVAGIVSSLSLALYPLFWSESHFNNEKDIPETVFWSFMIFCFWKGFTAKKSWWILLSGLFFGLALGTKFNILFIPLVLAPWLLFYWWVHYSKGFKLSLFLKDNIKLIVTAFIAILLGIIILMGSWPYLWPDPITRLISVLGFYKGIGFTQNINQNFLGPLGINTYALQWIIFTSPPVTLFLSVAGIIYSVIKIIRKKNNILLLFLLWLAVPIARVTWPGTTIYGGIRQIMEYIPAMAILAGIGAFWILNAVKKKKFIYFFFVSVIAISYSLSAIRLYKIHPNENVYFNFLIGGLKGAKEKDIPFWGNSFGAAYRQGVVWMNKNLPYGAKISYARELLPNIPMLWLRPDLALHNSFRSGYLKNGEYVIALVYQGVEKTSYFDEYLDRFLEPIYEVKVDDVPILKIWKNDTEHTKKEYLNEKETDNFTMSTKEGTTTFNFGGIVYLSRLEISYKEDFSCNKISSAYVQISENGDKWERLPGTMPNEDWSTPQIGIQPQNGKLIIPFAAERLRYLRIISFPADSCLTKVKNMKVYYFDKI